MSLTKLCTPSETALRLQLRGAIYRPDSLVLSMPRYCANLKAKRYESTSLNRIVADKSHSVVVALENFSIVNFFQFVFFFKWEDDPQTAL